MINLRIAFIFRICIYFLSQIKFINLWNTLSLKWYRFWKCNFVNVYTFLQEIRCLKKLRNESDLAILMQWLTTKLIGIKNISPLCLNILYYEKQVILTCFQSLYYNFCPCFGRILCFCGSKGPLLNVISFNCGHNACIYRIYLCFEI